MDEHQMATPPPGSTFKLGDHVITSFTHKSIGESEPHVITGPITDYQDPQNGTKLPWKVGGFWHEEKELKRLDKQQKPAKVTTE
jgi:hypothetical protein